MPLFNRKQTTPTWLVGASVALAVWGLLSIDNLFDLFT